MDFEEFPNLNIGLLGAIFENILLFLVYYFFFLPHFDVICASVQLWGGLSTNVFEMLTAVGI